MSQITGDPNCMKGLHLSVAFSLKTFGSLWFTSKHLRNMPPEGGEEAFVRVLAHEVVRLQERGMVVSPWSLVALILLQNPEGLDLDMLTKRTTWLRDLVLKFGAHLDWPGNVMG